MESPNCSAQAVPATLVVLNIGNKQLVTDEPDLVVVNASEGTHPATFFNAAMLHYPKDTTLVFLKEEQGLGKDAIAKIRRIRDLYGTKFLGMYSDYLLHIENGSTVYKTEPAFSEYNTRGHIVTSPLVLFRNPGPAFHPEIKGFTTHWVIRRFAKQALFYYEAGPVFEASPDSAKMAEINFNMETELIKNG